MNGNGLLMLAIGVALGVVVGRAAKQCAPPPSTRAGASDVLVGLTSLGGKVFDYFAEDDKK